MKINTQKQFVEMVGEKAVQKYKVSINPALMAALSGLYQNVAWAIVREYGTNMYDGYVKLPADALRRAPEIHVPNAMEPYIEFKDFGCGMSFETVWEVFTSYGLSTKWDNNEEVGGLGFGSKAAFCYDGCDSWTVESRYNGERMIFSACKDAEGNPNLVHLDTVKTDEPNGVTVKIPVSRRDIDRFKEEIRRFVMYFPMEIKVIGMGEEIPDIKYVLEGDDWGVLPRLKNQHGYAVGGQKIQIVMGNVPYPVDPSQAQGHKPQANTPANRYGFGQQTIPGIPNNIDIYAPVGSFDIVPSREGLMYNDRTVKALTKLFARIRTELPFRVDEEVASAKTAWAKVKRAHELHEIIGLSKSNQAHYRELSIPIDGLLEGEEEIVKYNNRSNTIEISSAKLLPGKSIVFDPNKHNVVYIDDLKKGPVVTSIRNDITNRIKTSGNSRGRYSYEDVVAYVIHNTARSQAEWEKLLRGFDNFVFVSNINVGRRNTVTEVSLGYFKTARSSTYNKDVYVRQGTDVLNPNDGTERFFVHAFNGTPSDIRNLDSVLRTMVSRGLLDPDKENKIYVLNKQHERFATRDGWVDFVAKFKPEVEKRVNAKREELCNDDKRLRLNHKVFDIIMAPKYRFNDPLVETLKKFKEAYALGTPREVEELKTLAHGFKIDYNVECPVEKAVNQFFAKYPMLTIVGDWAHRDTIAGYISGEIVVSNTPR